MSKRKQALVVESDLNRLVLRLELENLRATAERVDNAMATARRVGPWVLPAVSLLGGIFAGRRRRKNAKPSSLLRTAFRLAPALLAFWRKRSAPS